MRENERVRVVGGLLGERVLFVRNVAVEFISL